MKKYKEQCESLRKHVSELLFDIAVKNEIIKGLIKRNEKLNEENRRLKNGQTWDIGSGNDSSYTRPQ